MITNQEQEEIVGFLKEAKSLLERSSWVDHSPDTNQGEHCAYTVLGWTKGSSYEIYYKAKIFLVRGMGYLSFDDNQNLFDWNDSHTREEVLSAFDKAIELAENGD